MTKRVIISVILLILAITLSFSSYYMLDKKMSALGEALQNAVYANSTLETSCDEIEKLWKESKKMFHIFLLHSDLTNLETELNSLRYLKNDPDAFRKDCIRSLQMIHALEESIVPTIENIL